MQVTASIGSTLMHTEEGIGSPLDRLDRALDEAETRGLSLNMIA